MHCMHKMVICPKHLQGLSMGVWVLSCALIVRTSCTCDYFCCNMMASALHSVLVILHTYLAGCLAWDFGAELSSS